MRLQIEKLVGGGRGLARYNGQVVFVPHVLPGEIVEVDLLPPPHRTQPPDYLEGTVRQILEPALERRVPPCPLFGICGGCQLQHLTREAQCRYKREVLMDALARIGKLTGILVQPTVASPADFGYRCRVRFAVKHGQMGFYAYHTHRIVPVSECPILTSALNTLLKDIQGNLPLYTLSEVELQAATASGAPHMEEVLVILRGKQFPAGVAKAFYETRRPLLCGMVIETDRGRQTWGRTTLTYSGMPRPLRVRHNAFVQINLEVNRLIIACLMSQICKEDRVLEFYSGSGNITLPLSQHADSVTAIERCRHAVADARANLKGVTNVILRCAPVEQAIPTLKGPYTVAVLDPPREGVPSNVLTALARLRPQRIFYLSCDPATLARDLARLCKDGYTCTSVWPFDMFPQTAHVEALATLEAYPRGSHA